MAKERVFSVNNAEYAGGNNMSVGLIRLFPGSALKLAGIG